MNKNNKGKKYKHGIELGQWSFKEKILSIPKRKNMGTLHSMGQ